ncbi:DUF6705 family protein [Elizabethkingia anophelis]|uniref:DUF6705 family protein n=1 Tax=Elizabethkingia anophelis TaxID=1117645 RepID=UPI0021A89625
MKKTIFLTIFIICLCTKAQTVAITDTPRKIPNGIYLKDIDNTLPLFTGTWVASFEGKQVSLNISNRFENYPIKVLNNSYTSDVLFMRYIINDSNNNQLATTMDRVITNANIISTYPSKDKKRIGFSYDGEGCGIGEGLITLTIIDESHIKWTFRPTGGIIDKSSCPNADNIKSYIPRTLDLTFTKQ